MVVLKELLLDSRGILRVETSEQGPLNEFVNALRSYLEHGDWERRWVTIQFDPDNSNTRYFGGMLRQIERSLSLPADNTQAVVFGAGSKLGSDISASQVTINNSFNLGQDGYGVSVADESRAKRIVDIIRTRPESFCFLFVKSEGFQSHDLRSFLDLLWVNGLGELPPARALLIDFTLKGLRDDVDWPPTPMRNLKLAVEFDEQTRRDALADLSEFLLESRLETSSLTADAYSRALIDVCGTPAELYARLAAALVARTVFSEYV